MTPDEFRKRGVQLIEYIARYMETVQDRPVLSKTDPGDTAAMLPEHPPTEPGGDAEWNRILEDLDRIIQPGLTHWQHPGFYGYFPANASGPAILGELLSAGLGVQGMLWRTSPACTEIETRMLDWMAEACELPADFRSTSDNGGGVIQGTASESTLIALVAARRRVQRLGLEGEPVVYASTQAHSSVIKAAMIAGVARGQRDNERVRLIETDDAHAMRADVLAVAIERDIKAGRAPVFVCSTVGTTASTAVDPLGEIARAARAVGFKGWLHADGAHSGAAAVCPEHRWMLSGLDLYDSYCFNPHKQLLTNFDCDLFWTSDRSTLVDALSILPEYLRNAETESGRVIDYRDWQIPLGRRFRALKLWFVVRHYGIEGLRAHIRHATALASALEARIAEDPRLELCAPRPFNLVCFRPRPLPGESFADTDARTALLLERLNASGEVFLTHAALPAGGGEPDRIVIRAAIGGTATRTEHVQRLWELIDAETDRLDDNGPLA